METTVAAVQSKLENQLLKTDDPVILLDALQPFCDIFFNSTSRFHMEQIKNSSNFDL